MNYSNTFWLGKETTNRTSGPLFTPAEAYAFDTKIDDGKPGSGLVIARSRYAWTTTNACSTSISDTDYTGNYNSGAAINELVCSFHIKTGGY